MLILLQLELCPHAQQIKSIQWSLRPIYFLILFWTLSSHLASKHVMFMPPMYPIIYLNTISSSCTMKTGPNERLLCSMPTIYHLLHTTHTRETVQNLKMSTITTKNLVWKLWYNIKMSHSRLLPTYAAPIR